MFKNIITKVNTKYGKIIISILLGIGLASIFRKSCESRNCLIFNAPSFEEVGQSIYKHSDKCYKYTEQSVLCNPGKNKQVDIA
jgi:hypothetical protein